MRYEDIVNELEQLIEYIKDDYIKKKLEEISNAIDELYEDNQWKIAMLSEDVDMLEEELKDYRKY